MKIKSLILKISILFNEINSFYGLLDMSASYKGISLHTSNKTYFNKSNGISFKPIQSEFIIGCDYSIKRLSIGYQHMCSHGIEYKWFTESYDRIYLKYKLF